MSATKAVRTIYEDSAIVCKPSKVSAIGLTLIKIWTINTNEEKFNLMDNSLTISELKKVPYSTIMVLAKVLENYEALDSNESINKIVVTLRWKIDISVLSLQPEGCMQWHDTLSIEKKECPLSFIKQLEQAKKDKNSWVGGHPCVVIDISKEVRDYIMKRSRSGESGVKNKLLHWIRSWIK